jgi:hypothetical protein
VNRLKAFVHVYQNFWERFPAERGDAVLELQSDSSEINRLYEEVLAKLPFDNATLSTRAQNRVYDNLAQLEKI